MSQSQNPYVSPTLNATAFNCPHCGAYAKQDWGRAMARVEGSVWGIDGCEAAFCSHCQAFSLWVGGDPVYPATSSAPLPNPDLADEIREDFLEARAILPASPRGAAALLRLCVQKLCAQLGLPGKNINDDIRALVQRGLSPMLQQALDVLRVIGNHAVHPGQIDLSDDRETATRLFHLVNLVADQMLTQPKQVQALYGVLPAGQLEQIERRDRPAGANVKEGA